MNDDLTRQTTLLQPASYSNETFRKHNFHSKVTKHRHGNNNYYKPQQKWLKIYVLF